MENDIGVNKQRRIAVLLSYCTMAISTILSLVYTPYMLKCLGQSQYGIYQLIGSLSNYLTLLSFGLSSSYIRFYSKIYEKSKEEGIKKLNCIYLAVFSIISCIATVVGLIVAFNLPIFFGKTMTNEELSIGRALMFLTTANVAITLPTNIFTSYIAVNERFVFQRIVTLVYAIAHPVLSIVALSIGGKAISIVFVALLCTTAMTIVEVLYCIKKLRFSVAFQDVEWKLFGEIFSFSFFIFINDVINQVNWSVDKIILGAMSGSVAIAIYGIAAQLNTYFLGISTNISSVFAPQVNRIVASSVPDEEKTKVLNRLFLRVGKIQSYIVLLVITGYVFFGQQFINLWAGDGYQQSYYVGLWLMIPVIVPLTQNVGIEIQRAKNKHKIRSLIYGAIAIANVFLSISLCRLYGPVGCAIGTAASLIGGNIIFINWYYYKKLDIDIPAFWKQELKILPILILPAVVGFFLMKTVVICNYFILAGCIAIYCIAYCLSLFFIGMNKEERATIVLKIRNKLKG